MSVPIKKSKDSYTSIQRRIVEGYSTGIYTGIGSRETPKEIMILMEKVSKCLATQGLTLRSGGAPGADSAFEKGCDSVEGKKEIYLPWKGFNKNPSDLYRPHALAFEAAMGVHPRWGKCSPAARCLHARNVHQVLGKSIATPVLPSFVLLWAEPCTKTPTNQQNKVKGGSATAVTLAQNFNIPVFNLFEKNIRINWENLLEVLKETHNNSKVLKNLTNLPHNLESCFPYITKTTSVNRR